MKLALDYEIDVDVRKNGETVEKLIVFYREPTKAERKVILKKFKEFQKLSKSLTKIERKASLSDQRANAYRSLDESEKVLKQLELQEVLGEEIEIIIEKMENFGGDDYAETQARSRFDMLVSGKDAKNLGNHAEAMGYGRMMSYLDKEKDALIEKQFGKSQTA